MSANLGKSKGVTKISLDNSCKILITQMNLLRPALFYFSSSETADKWTSALETIRFVAQAQLNGDTELFQKIIDLYKAIQYIKKILPEIKVDIPQLEKFYDYSADLYGDLCTTGISILKTFGVESPIPEDFVIVSDLVAIRAAKEAAEKLETPEERLALFEKVLKFEGKDRLENIKSYVIKFSKEESIRKVLLKFVYDFRKSLSNDYCRVLNAKIGSFLSHEKEISFINFKEKALFAHLRTIQSVAESLLAGKNDFFKKREDLVKAIQFIEKIDTLKIDIHIDELKTFCCESQALHSHLREMGILEPKRKKQVRRSVRKGASPHVRTQSSPLSLGLSSECYVYTVKMPVRQIPSSDDKISAPQKVTPVVTKGKKILSAHKNLELQNKLKQIKELGITHQKNVEILGDLIAIKNAIDEISKLSPENQYKAFMKKGVRAKLKNIQKYANAPNGMKEEQEELRIFLKLMNAFMESLKEKQKAVLSSVVSLPPEDRKKEDNNPKGEASVEEISTVPENKEKEKEKEKEKDKEKEESKRTEQEKQENVESDSDSEKDRVVINKDEEKIKNIQEPKVSPKLDNPSPNFIFRFFNEVADYAEKNPVAAVAIGVTCVLVITGINLVTCGLGTAGMALLGTSSLIVAGYFASRKPSAYFEKNNNATMLDFLFPRLF